MKRIIGWKHSKEAVAVLLALGLYALGIKLLLLPVIIALNARYLPMPSIFRSWMGRLFGAVMWTAVLLQIAATTQFIVWPDSNFTVMAAIFVLLQILVWKFIPVQPYERRRYADLADAGAIITAAIFLLPFVPMLAKGPVEAIAQIGGLQAIDATNHYAGIAEVTHAEHLTYAPNYYYPKGFHIATGFVQNSIFASQYSLGWQGNVVLFFAQYVLLAIGLAYAAYYFAVVLLRALKYKLQTFGKHFLLAATLGPSLALFYLLPMVNEGFLNYYYVITTILLGLLYLADIRERQPGDADDWRSIFNDSELRWGVIAYLVLAYGASVSWPLLIPPLVVTAAIFVVPVNLNLWAALKALMSPRGWPVLLAFLIQLIPIYFQLRYASSDGSQGGLNAIGGLKEYHPFVLLAGVGLMLGVAWSSATDSFKRFLLSVYLPLAAFVLMIVSIQYFLTGEVRYYAIKSSILLEMMTLILGVVALICIHAQRGTKGLLYAWLLPAVPVVAMLLLISTTPNPFRDIRELLRPYSGQSKPIFYDQDVERYLMLAKDDKVQHFNSTTLHYNHDQGKFFAHSQLAFWFNMMQYDASSADLKALDCNGKLYGNLAFGTFSGKEQQELIAKVKECAARAHNRGQNYYIITDAQSEPMLRATLGGIAIYVK